MSRIRQLNGSQAIFCPACHALHVLDARWRYNYNADKLTFKPEVRITAGPFGPDHVHAGKTHECHFRIEAGSIIYYPSSTHELKGTSTPLPDFEDLAAARSKALAAQ